MAAAFKRGAGTKGAVSRMISVAFAAARRWRSDRAILAAPCEQRCAAPREFPSRGAEHVKLTGLVTRLPLMTTLLRPRRFGCAAAVLALLAGAPMTGCESLDEPASGRSFPTQTKLGNLQIVQAPTVSVDGKSLRLSPGAVIRNTDNLIVTPNAISGSVPVRYQVDGLGNVSAVWILTSAEYRAALREPQIKQPDAPAESASPLDRPRPTN